MGPPIEPSREHAVTFGPDQHLVGLVTPSVGRGRPAVVYLNAGVIHRVGPHRLHVVLAWRLAEHGFPGLRVDLSGIGDSRPLPGTMTFRESAVADTRSAMDFLSNADPTARFVLFGICAGADNALAAADADRRVAAVVVVDPAAYRTRRARIRKAAWKLRSFGGPAGAAAWLSRASMRGARALATRILRPRDHEHDGDDAPAPGRQTPPSAEYGALLRRLHARGVRILSIYSGSLDDRYNHRGQLFERFPDLRGKVDVLFFPDANHVFTERAMQASLIDGVETWLTRNFP
jgi:pimeloyl-ACP methyl ester carboxylesterase